MSSPYQFPNMPEGFDFFRGEPLSEEVWRTKYRYQNEANMEETLARCAQGIYVNDTIENGKEALDVMTSGLWMPGGRIIAGAGTSKRVTLMNCYVDATLDDSMEGIADGYRRVMLTMQQGGGIGTDFTPLRPKTAWLNRTQSPASGPLPFMDAQNSISDTIQSAGDRSGAMMATLADTHPDLPEFIIAKQTKGRLKNFNLSVLVSDAFMAAKDEDEEWLLHHVCPPLVRDDDLVARDFTDEEGTHYVYSVWRARELWELITRNTYLYSEPGVIFIDRVNDHNNLSYCETIRCTNPCGEQPLPPNGTCNLGAVNLALMVRNPFTDDAEFDYDLLRQTVRIGTRFLDNVIDVTGYPLIEQELEEKAKRRLGLGKAGLAAAFAECGIRYGSVRSVRMCSEISRQIALTTYETSTELAEERGAFPLYDKKEFWSGESFAAQRFKDQNWFGRPMRNGVLNTEAPTGTTSCAFGNIPASGEPEFMYEYQRNLTQKDKSLKPIICRSFTKRLWDHINPDEPLPKYFVTTEELKVHEHIAIQSASQEWVDASISKTINLPEETSYEDFVTVYDLAYESGLKGCTTYRPSEVRGSILQKESKTDTAQTTEAVGFVRPDYLDSRTVKMKWPELKSALYITLGILADGRPYEVFFNSKDQRYNEWMTLTTLLLSWLLRAGIPLKTLAEELQQIQSIEGGWAEQRFHPSLVAFIGTKLLDLDCVLKNLPAPPTSPKLEPLEPGSGQQNDTRQSDTDGLAAVKSRMEQSSPSTTQHLPKCTRCRSTNMKLSDGCLTCLNCGDSKCA